MGNVVNRNVQAPSSRKWESSRSRREQQQQQQQQQLGELKVSTWSLGNLSERLNWSFSSSSRAFSSFSKSGSKSRLNRSKSSRQSSKTAWHVPFTDSIFLPHFKRLNLNENYSINEVIAQGAFGIVFKVTKKSKEKLVYALKVLSKSKIIKENSVQQIKDEIDIQKLCGHHPFVVKQIDSWQSRSKLYILLEYLPNGELFNKISRFPYELVRLYIAEIALAIDFLHNAGVIYRDVKPENILLTSDYHVKLTDFGLSKWLKFGECTRTICGTFQYMAPEILRGEPYSHAIDWWALGVVACRMLTKKYPNTRYLIKEHFSKDLLEDTSKENLTAEEYPYDDDQFLPSEANKIPKEGKDLLNRLLEYDSKMRLRSILGLQRIAMYKDFKINMEALREISPLEIFRKNNIPLDVAEEHEFLEF